MVESSVELKVEQRAVVMESPMVVEKVGMKVFHSVVEKAEK